MRGYRPVWTVILLLAGALTARADVIHLHAGGVIKGDIVSRTRAEIVVRTAGGTTTSIARSQVSFIEEGASPEEMHEERLAEIDRDDPEARYALGLWLKSIGCEELAREEFLATCELDPDHRFARYELGHVRRDGEWVPRSSLESSTEEGEAETVARKPRPTLRGASRALQRAAVDLRETERPEDRAAVWAVLLDEEAEAQRMLAALTGEGSAKKAAWGVLRREVPAAEDLDPAAANREELAPLAEQYVAEVVRPRLDEALGRYGRWIERRWRRVERELERLIPDYDPGATAGRRSELLTEWVEVRDDAVETIFDESIYPDRNHGREGQPIVDEKVDAVRAVWETLDPLLERDTRRVRGLDPAEAKELLARVEALRTRAAELRERQRARGLEAQTVPTVPALHRALLAYRTEDWEAVEGAAEGFTPYAAQLLTRVRNARVMAKNASFAREHPRDDGVQPTGPEVEQVRITNDYRLMMGRPALEIDPRLVDSARGHSQDMTRLGFFDHTSPVSGKESPSQRMRKAGYPGTGGENISLGSTTPHATHDSWYNSSGHHRNILGKRWRAMGSGRDGKHWTQNFGSAR